MSQHQPQWDFYSATIENEPSIIALDIALADVAPIEELPFMLWASVKMMAPDEQGFPTEDEARTLTAIEDELTERLRDIDAIQVGRIQSSGVQDLYFYGSDGENFEKVVLEVMKHYPDYLFATDVAEDEDWDEYLGRLYPDHYNYQCMQNRRVIDELVDEGDDLTKERDVDHFIGFQNEAAMKKFAEAAVDNGFKILSQDKRIDDELPYLINIVRKDIADLDTVNEYVWAVCELAETYNGEYEGWGCDAVK